MAMFNSTLFSLSSQVSAHKPNANKAQIGKDINARIRALLDFRNSWSALISKTVLNIPQAYSTGSVNMTSGSTAVTGTATAWPVADKINTTMLGGNRQTGYQEITPASMTGIAVDSLLYINDGVFSEVVPVVEITNSTFVGIFQFSHNDGSTLTMSSLAGLQLRLGPLTPIYTLLGVSSATSGIIDVPFGGAPLTAASYSLLMAYVTVDPNLRSFLQVWDPTQGIQLRTNVSQAELNSYDAQRTSSGSPQCLGDLAPNVSGSMQYELWPYQTTPYSIPVLFNKQWPELKRPTDRPPHWINPSVIIDGAIADALRRKDIRGVDDKDPYFNPGLAKDFDAKFLAGAVAAAMADENHCQQALTNSNFERQGAGANAAYWQSHVSEFGDW